jgi:hypothetical protein
MQKVEGSSPFIRSSVIRWKRRVLVPLWVEAASGSVPHWCPKRSILGLLAIESPFVSYLALAAFICTEPFV